MFMDELKRIEIELTNLKSYFAKKTSEFKTKEMDIIINAQFELDGTGDYADVSVTKYYRSINNTTPLASPAIDNIEDVVGNVLYQTIELAPITYYKSIFDQPSGAYRLYIAFSTNNPSIISRLKNGETVIIPIHCYITTTATLEEY